MKSTDAVVSNGHHMLHALQPLSVMSAIGMLYNFFV